jgi:hypothetical protein
MKAKTVLLFVLMLVLIPPLARSAPITGAQIQTWTYDADSREVSVRILNTSSQPITAFVLLVKTVSGQWRINYDFFTARVSRETMRSLSGTEPDVARRKPEAIAVGGYYDEKIPVQSDKDFFAAIEAVAYENLTAEAVNPEALQNIIDRRKAQVNAIEKANAVILASVDHDSAAKEIEKMIAQK